MASDSGSTGVLGVIIGAVLVLAILFFVAGGPRIFTGGGNTTVAIEAPKTPAPVTR